MNPKKPPLLSLKETELYFYNGAKLGEILPDVDGYYKFFPELKGGYWDPYVMRAIADMLDNMNKEWDEIIANDPRIN